MLACEFKVGSPRVESLKNCFGFLSRVDLLSSVWACATGGDKRLLSVSGPHLPLVPQCGGHCNVHVLVAWTDFHVIH